MNYTCYDNVVFRAQKIIFLLRKVPVIVKLIRSFKKVLIFTSCLPYIQEYNRMINAFENERVHFEG